MWCPSRQTSTSWNLYEEEDKQDSSSSGLNDDDKEQKSEAEL